MYSKRTFLSVYNTLLMLYDIIPEDTWILGEYREDIFPLSIKEINTESIKPRPLLKYLYLMKNRSIRQEEICILRQPGLWSTKITTDTKDFGLQYRGDSLLPPSINALCGCNKLSLNFKELIEYFSKLPTSTIDYNYSSELYLGLRDDLFTTYINGVGFNKKELHINDTNFEKGEALVINMDITNKLPQGSICDFSLNWGSFRKKPAKLNKYLYARTNS